LNILFDFVYDRVYRGVYGLPLNSKYQQLVISYPGGN